MVSVCAELDVCCCWLCCARSDGWLILVVLHCLSVGYVRPFFFFLESYRFKSSSTYLGFGIKKII